MFNIDLKPNILNIKMTEISFIYKHNNNETINYGKIKLSYISDDHSGLDREIKEYVWNLLSYILSVKNEVLRDLHIGVIGTLTDNSHSSHFTSDKLEMSIFNMYIINRKDFCKYYYNGRDVTELADKFVTEKNNEYTWYDSVYGDSDSDSSTINSEYDNNNNKLYVSDSDINDKMSIEKSDTISELEYQYEELELINVTPEPTEEELQETKYF